MRHKMFPDWYTLMYYLYLRLRLFDWRLKSLLRGVKISQCCSSSVQANFRCQVGRNKCYILWSILCRTLDFRQIVSQNFCIWSAPLPLLPPKTRRKKSVPPHPNHFSPTQPSGPSWSSSRKVRSLISISISSRALKTRMCSGVWSRSRSWSRVEP